MLYDIKISDNAMKFLGKLNVEIKNRIIKRIYSLADNPRSHGCIKLAGDEKYRVRVGDYRVIYIIEDKVLKVCVVKIGHRKNVYD